MLCMKDKYVMTKYFHFNAFRLKLKLRGVIVCILKRKWIVDVLELEYGYRALSDQ